MVAELELVIVQDDENASIDSTVVQDKYKRELLINNTGSLRS